MVSYMIFFFCDDKILTDFAAHYQYFYFCGEKWTQFLYKKVS